MAGEKPPEPWHSFLQELDQQLTEETRLHCRGGFVKEEMRPYLSNEAKHDLTIQLWVQMMQEVRASRNI